ncbi:LysE family translocator [Acetobacteraceae bacterium]|nr:LysE family translocator [Acetobacteraceae bacterium]
MFSSLFAFILTAGPLMMTPGLETALVLRTSISEGHRAGFGVVLGICIAVAFWGSAAAFGLTALLAGSPFGFFLLKMVGALFLIYLGFNLLRKPHTSLFDPKEVGVNDKIFILKAIRNGLTTTLCNPGFALVVLALFPQFVPPHYPVAQFVLLETVIQMVLAALWFGALVAGGIPLRSILGKPTVIKNFDRLTGIVFIAFGILLLTMTRPN